MDYGMADGSIRMRVRAAVAGYTPGRYVGAEAVEDDGEPFEEKMQGLVAQLDAQFSESAKLEKAICENLTRLGYGL